MSIILSWHHIKDYHISVDQLETREWRWDANAGDSTELGGPRPPRRRVGRNRLRRGRGTFHSLLYRPCSSSSLQRRAQA